MIDRQELHDAWQYILLIAPAPIGALIGLRYAVEQTPRVRALTFLCSMGLGAIVGAFVGEFWQLGPAAVAFTTVVAASIGMEVMAGLNVAARFFSADPLGFLGKAFELAARVFRRGES